MENQIDPFADKSTWGPGPWQDEPDRLEWRDATTGLPCLAVRGPLGQWCFCGFWDTTPGARLSMWTIFDHPLDEPNHVVIRKFDILPDDPNPRPSTKILFSDLETARAHMRPDKVCLGRFDEDLPCIVESWI